MNELLNEFMNAPDPDAMLRQHVDGLIERRRRSRAGRSAVDDWRPDRPLRLLLAGYVGAANVGADLRVFEMIRQFRTILGDGRAEFSVVVLDKRQRLDSFRDVHKLELTYIPAFLREHVAAHDGAIACEGSTFKSNFSESVSMIMLGAIGLAGAENKLAIAYGVEAGKMVPDLRDFVARHCREALVFCRSEPSRRLLDPLGLRTAIGSDTAWTFWPEPADRGAAYLRAAGWNGIDLVLGLCPVNPFWWPVRADLDKARALEQDGRFRELHYGSVFFHHSSPTSERAYRDYLRGMADAVVAFARDRSIFPVVIGMDRCDRAACEDLVELFPSRPPVLLSTNWDARAIVSILRRCHMLVSSRFHAIVSSMPGSVPSVGVSMDERINHLLAERGHEDLLLVADDPCLGETLHEALRRLERDRERIVDESKKMVAEHVRRMGQMGLEFLDEICRVYPEFERRELPRSWEAHLPRLPPELDRLLGQYL
jgi:polysaccharide pyruvyl transferase WcaK-like protein